MPETTAEVNIEGVLEADFNEDETFGPQDWDGICEVRTSPSGNFAPNGASVTRIYDVPWDRYYNFVRELIGYPFMAGGEMRRKLPDRDAEVPGLYCTKVSKPLDGGFFQSQSDGAVDFPLASHGTARIAATYESLKYSVKRLSDIDTTPKELQRYCIKRVRGAGEYLSAQWGELIFDDGSNTQVSSRVGIWQPASIITYELFDFHPDAWNPDRVEKELVGRTNEAAFDGREAETLLLLSSEYDWEVTPLGERVHRITLTMFYKPTGINKAPKPGSGTPTPMKYIKTALDGSPVRPVQPVDFGLLFAAPF